jgi:hypothetical protein
MPWRLDSRFLIAFAPRTGLVNLHQTFVRRSQGRCGMSCSYHAAGATGGLNSVSKHSNVRREANAAVVDRLSYHAHPNGQPGTSVVRPGWLK